MSKELEQIKALTNVRSLRNTYSKKKFLEDITFALCVGKINLTAIRVRKVLEKYGIPEECIQAFMRVPLCDIAKAISGAKSQIMLKETETIMIKGEF